MNEAVLAGKKIGIVVENKFIPDEIAAYQSHHLDQVTGALA